MIFSTTRNPALWVGKHENTDISKLQPNNFWCVRAKRTSENRDLMFIYICLIRTQDFPPKSCLVGSCGEKKSPYSTPELYLCRQICSAWNIFDFLLKKGFSQFVCRWCTGITLRLCSWKVIVFSLYSASSACCLWAQVTIWLVSWAGEASVTTMLSCCRSWRSWSEPPPKCWTGKTRGREGGGGVVSSQQSKISNQVCTIQCLLWGLKFPVKSRSVGLRTELLLAAI